MQKAIILATAGSALAGGPTFEVSSSDLTGSNRAFDNIKATWSQTLKVLGRDATLTGSYDRSENKDFLNEATLTGKSGNINYELSTKFSGSTGYTLETELDGNTITAEGTTDIYNPLDSSVSKLTAARSGLNVRGNDYDLEISHAFDDNESKLKLSSVLGAGLKAIGTVANKGGASSTTIDVEYDTTLGAGRTLHLEANPKAGTGEIEYEDSTTLDGTLTANIPLGGTPKVSFKRSFNF